MTGRGRRPGTPGTREQILRTAHELFARHGYEETSVRAVARAAGVDPALVRHYFADKTALFLAAAQIGFDPRLLVRRLAAGGVAGMGERMLAVVLPLWESPLGSSVAAVGAREPRLMAIFARVVAGSIESAAEQTLAELTPAERRVRVAMLQSAMGGLFATRYIFQMEPVASLPTATIIKRWAPLLQGILDEGR